MRAWLVPGCLAVIGAAVAVSVPAAAQEAVELPAIEVTAPTVAKKSTKAKRPASSAKPPPSSAQLPEALPALQPSAAPAEETGALGAVGAGDLAATSGATLTDALATRPGIAGSAFTPGASRPIVRGLDGTRVRIQENGIGTHDVSALSEDHAVPVDPLAAQRVEILRGPEALRYGSQSAGGIVSVESGRIARTMPKGGFTGSLTGGGTSVDDGHDAVFSATAGARGVVVHADGFRRRADDYDTPRGPVENSFVESDGGALGASAVGADGYFGVALQRVESLYGIAADEVAIDLAQTKFTAEGERRLRNGIFDAVRFQFGASDYGHDEVELESGDVGSRFGNREVEARVELQHTPLATAAGRLEGLIGVQAGHRELTGTSFEGASLLEPAQAESVAGFVFEELAPTPTLRIQAAARIEATRVEGTGLTDVSDPAAPVSFRGARSFTPASASLSLIRDLPGGLALRLTGQHLERAPDAAELFSKGLHEATGTFEIGNPRLDIESANGVEIGLTRNGAGVRFEASLYRTDYDGFIFRQLTGAACGDTLASCGAEDELDLVLFRQRDARFEGGEVAAEADVAEIAGGMLGIDAQYDRVRARFTNGEAVPRIPPQRIGGGLWWRSEAWRARVGALHAFEQDEIGANEIATPGYTLVSAEIAVTLRDLATDGFARELTLGIKGENLADEEVLNHASFRRRDGILEPGASVRVFGSVKLN